MVKPRLHRRTLLKTIGTGVVGSATLTGTTTAAPGRARGRRNELEIVASHDHDANQHLFDLSTNEIASGWTTFELDNQTEHTHFVYTSKIPDAAMKDAEEHDMDLLTYWIDTVTDPFQWFMDFLHPDNTADPNDLSELQPFPPNWFDKVVWYGGPGLTARDHTSRTTVELDPGKYIVECYVKDANNDFHSYLGMIDLLTVTDNGSGASEPDSTLDLKLSTENGIEVDENVRPGQHIVGVEVVDQQTYTNLVGHDVHLIRLDDQTNADDVNNWMDWSNGLRTETTDDDYEGLISDGTEPGTFIGGTQDIWTTDLPRTGYYHVNLKPGDYAWVAEIPQPDEKGFLQEFSVP